MSLPSRERGLKLLPEGIGLGALQSLPSRERGLKLVLAQSHQVLDQSLPSRERGLKLNRTAQATDKNGVAPFTGAWIEIFY